MIQSSNPFNDPEVRKQILKDEGKLDQNLNIDSDYDIIDDTASVSSDIKSIVANAPKIPKSASNLILDANAIAKNARDVKAKEMNLALNRVFTEYNKKYGTSLSINFENISQTLVDVADPSKRQVLELYVSEVFKSMKPIMLLHLISRLSLVLDYVLDPQRLFDSNQLNLADQIVLVEKLQQYIMNLTDILDSDAVVKDSDKVLKKLADEKNNDDINSAESKEMVDNFMSLFRKESGLNE